MTLLNPQEERLLYGTLKIQRKIDIMFCRMSALALAVVVGIGLGLLWAGMQG